MTPRTSRSAMLLLFVLCSIVLAAVSVWVLQHNYLNNNAMLRWSQVLTTLSAPTLRVEDFGLVYPAIPVYLLSVFFVVPGLNSPLAPYLLSVLIGSALLVLWFIHLRREKGYSNRFTLLLVLLVGSHPFFLWSVTTGTEKALSLFMFYLLCLSFVRLAHLQDVRAFIMLGWVLAVYFLIDQRTLFLFLALLPLLPLLAPPAMLRESARSVYLMFALPLVIFVCSWAYVNWVFRGTPWLFITAPDSGFLGSRLLVDQTPWLQDMGGYLLEPTVISLLLSLLAFPVLLWIILHARRNVLLLRSTLVFFLHPLLALVMATYAYFIDHPVGILFLFIAALMAIFMLLPRLGTRQRRVLVLLLILGNSGGWLAMSYAPTPDMRNWRNALLGQSLPGAFEPENRLGQWLAKNRHPTLMDNTLGFRTILARQDAYGLVLPNSKEFKLALKHSALRIDQIVVIDPRVSDAARDQITQRYPDLYDHGLPSHSLVYDQDYWRVYRSKDLP